MDLIGLRVSDLDESEYLDFVEMLRAGFLGVQDGRVTVIRRK